MGRRLAGRPSSDSGREKPQNAPAAFPCHSGAHALLPAEPLRHFGQRLAVGAPYIQIRENCGDRGMASKFNSNIEPGDEVKLRAIVTAVWEYGQFTVQIRSAGQRVTLPMAAARE
jgi:hypothetical protein